MDAVTYPDERVIDFIEQHLIPVRVLITSHPLPQEFSVQWTPTLVLLDPDGKEHHRTVGWLAPDDLISSLMLGLAKSHFERGEQDKAARILDQLLAEHASAEFAPEALYLREVIRYKQSGDIRILKDMYRQLQSKSPESVWTKRASVYLAA